MYLIYLALAGIAALAGMLWITPHGAGVSPDSSVYIEAARNILAGTTPTDWPAR